MITAYVHIYHSDCFGLCIAKWIAEYRNSHKLLSGSKSFQYPTTTGSVKTIEGTAFNVTVIIKQVVQPFLVDPNATHVTYSYQGVDAGLWHNGTAYLLLVSNNVNAEAHVPWGEGCVTNVTTQVQRIFSVEQTANTTGLNLRRPGSIGIYTATP